MIWFWFIKVAPLSDNILRVNVKSHKPGHRTISQLTYIFTWDFLIPEDLTETHFLKVGQDFWLELWV